MKPGSLALSLAAVSSLVGVASFTATTTTTTLHSGLRPHATTSPSRLGLAKPGKGFGASPEPPKKKQETDDDKPAVAAKDDAPARGRRPHTDEDDDNAGQRALRQLRRQRAEQKDAELRRVRDLLAADEQLQSTPAAIPERVAQRMGRRMVPAVGIPLLGGMGCFVAFWYLATYRDLEFQPALVAFSTIAILVVGLLGITYSVMSASWDEDREGSFWGLDEFQRNVDNIKEGLQRSKDNVALRDKLETASDEEVSRALQDLERREKKASAPKTLGEKLEQDGFD